MTEIEQRAFKTNLTEMTDKEVQTAWTKAAEETLFEWDLDCARIKCWLLDSVLEPELCRRRIREREHDHSPREPIFVRLPEHFDEVDELAAANLWLITLCSFPILTPESVCRLFDLVNRHVALVLWQACRDRPQRTVVVRAEGFDPHDTSEFGDDDDE